MKLQKEGIGKDKRPYYRDFIKDLHSNKIKSKKVEKFITDNLQMVRRGTVLYNKCSSIMQTQM